MTRTLVALLMLQAGVAPTGSVTGIVRTVNGNPTAGVRVYAHQVRDTADANSPVAPLEGIAQTDASGRYRLELPAGRYYIASGSVSAPTCYPGATSVASAGQTSPRVIRANVNVEDDQVKVQLISTPVQQSPLAPVSSQAPVTIDVPKLP